MKNAATTQQRAVVDLPPVATNAGDISVRLLPSCRLTLGLMTSLALFLLYMLRVNLSLTLVCMVKTTWPLNATSANDNDTSSDKVQDGARGPAQPNDSFGSQEVSKGEFEWSRQFQGVLLSSYFYGYLGTQLIGGWLAGRYGGKHVLGAGVLGAVISTLLTPAAARIHRALLVALRVVLGASSGMVFPTIQSLWGIWAPPLERSFLSSLSYFGMSLGFIAALASSLFCEISLDNGWPFAFYVTGGAGLLFWISWNFLAYSSPDTHPRISERERVYITTTTGIKNTHKVKRAKFPWTKALTSPAVLAILVAQTASTWFSYTAATTLPLYMKDVLNFDIKQSGLFLMLPNLAVLVVCIPMGQVADLLRRRRIFTTKTVRKIYQGISSFGCSILLILLGFLDESERHVAVALIVALYVVQTFCRCGFLINPQDIAPRYSGEIFGIANTMGAVSGIVAPVVVGLLTPHGTRLEWQTVFYIASGLFILGGLLFVLFAEGEVLDWAKTSGDIVITDVDKANADETTALRNKSDAT